MNTKQLTNEWIDLIRDEAMLVELVQGVVEREVVGVVYPKRDEINGLCLSLAYEVAEDEGYDLEFVYDLEVKFDATYIPEPGGVAMTAFKVTSLFLHEKAM